eukprot:4568457-Prymnesium_polylepis.1
MASSSAARSAPRLAQTSDARVCTHMGAPACVVGVCHRRVSSACIRFKRVSAHHHPAQRPAVEHCVTQVYNARFGSLEGVTHAGPGVALLEVGHWNPSGATALRERLDRVSARV